MTTTTPDTKGTLVAGQYDPSRVIRCVRCWVPLTDDETVVRVPFAATGQPSVAHAGDCPEVPDA